jgi:hypothetical protein
MLYIIIRRYIHKFLNLFFIRYLLLYISHIKTHQQKVKLFLSYKIIFLYIIFCILHLFFLYNIYIVIAI